MYASRRTPDGQCTTQALYAACMLYVQLHTHAWHAYIVMNFLLDIPYRWVSDLFTRIGTAVLVRMRRDVLCMLWCVCYAGEVTQRAPLQAARGRARRV